MIKAPEHTHVVIPIKDMAAANPPVQLFDRMPLLLFIYLTPVQPRDLPSA